MSKAAVERMGNSSASQSGNSATSPLDSLVQMGFPQQQATIALQATANNMEAALELLTEQREAEERLKRVSAAEKRASTAGTKPIAPVVKQPPVKQPMNVQQPTSSAQTSSTFADLATKFSDVPEAVDTLHYVLRTIRENPTEAKYRSIKTTNARFLETIGKDARTRELAETFMRMVGFERAGEWLSLPPNFDRLQLGQAVDALQTIQSSSVYLAAKRNLEFERVMEASRSSANEEELKRRALFAAKLPPVPPDGAAGTTRVNVVITEGAPPLTRRFASDDVLLDVVHWIGSERSVVCNKILEGDWSLVDETLLQKKQLDVNGSDGHKSLFALNLWPSATLHVRLRA